LDSGANCNLISLQHLTNNEKQTIDKKSVIKITGFNKQSLTTFSLGKVEIPIHTKQRSPKLQFHVMPAHTLNYNIIGIHDIRKHFLSNLLECSNKEHSTPILPTGTTSPSSLTPPTPMRCCTAQIQRIGKKTAQHATAIKQLLTYEQASQLYSEIPTPAIEKQQPPKPLINQKWFKALWTLFPRLAMEHENLSEPNRLPHKFFVKTRR